MENEKVLQELREIKELLKQLLEEQKWTNDNIVEATRNLQQTIRLNH